MKRIFEVKEPEPESKMFIIADTLDNIVECFSNFISGNGFYTNRRVDRLKYKHSSEKLAQLSVMYKQLSVKEQEIYLELIKSFKK